MEEKASTENLQNDTKINNTKPETIDPATICDSTSIHEVIIFVNKHTLIDKAGIFNNIEHFINTPVPQQQAEKDSLTKTGLALLNEFNGMFNIAESGVDAVFTKYSIYRGLILIQLKILVKRAGQSWDAWSTKNIPFLSQRVRIDNMRLAYRQDCHPYYLLGSERLLMLIRATESQKGDDKIGQFLTKHGIKFNPESIDQLKKFKLQVDAALNTEKLEKVKVKANPQIVKTLTQYMPVMDNNFLMKAQAIEESGGDVNKHFEKLVINKGKEKSPFEINKAIADFNSSGVKLIQIVDYILKNEDAIETLEAEIVTELAEKLAELKNFANIQ